MTTPVDGGGPSSPSTGVIDGGGVLLGEAAWTSDPAQVVTRALAVMRLDDDDADADRIAAAAQAAVGVIDSYLDRPVPYTLATVPGAVLEAATTVTVELYKRKDAPFGVFGAWSSDGEAMRIARDVLAGVEYLLMPYKGGWGLA